MSTPFDKILADFSGEAPGSKQSIEEAEKELGKPLPPDYQAFLLRHNGGEGFIGKHYLILWTAEELAEGNREYEVEEYAPGLVAFGSNGGGVRHPQSALSGSAGAVYRNEFKRCGSSCG